jgi:hypothetical protein
VQELYGVQAGQFTRLTTVKILWGANPICDKRFFSSPKCPDWFWSPLNLLLNRGLGLFSGVGKVVRA